MKIRTLSLTAAAVVLACSAHATPFGETFNPAKLTIVTAADGSTSGTYNGNPVGQVLFLSGASASAKTVGTFVINDNCDATSLSVLWDSASGSNYRAYACDTKAGNIILNNAIDSLVVIKRDAGGSAQGVNPILSPAPISFMKVDSSCVATGGVPSLNVPNYTCAGTANYYPDAGLSDVEPGIILDAVNGGSTSLVPTGTTTIKSIFQQLIGVTVNTKLYRALQATQGLTQDDDPANRPSLSTDFVSSVVLGKTSSTSTGKRGWGLVVSSTVDPTATTKQVNICRRAAGSGTQAAANIQFAGNPCSSGKQTPLTAQNTPAVIGTSIAVVEGSSTGAVESCMGSIDALTQSGTDNKAYAIGHIGRDNDPFAGGGDKGYRFVKLDGAQPEAHPDPTTGQCNSTRNFPGCTDAQTGKYSYVYESTMQWNNTTPGNAAKVTALNNIATKGFLPAQLTGNNAAVIAGVMALPTSYSGAFESLALGSASQVYGSRITRGANSCSPVTFQK
jgi:hypothetical protein